MVQHALDRGYQVVGVCREQSVEKLDRFKGGITVTPEATNDPEVIERAVAGCDRVLVVLTPRGVPAYSTGTAQAMLDHAPPDARLVLSCGWHISRDGGRRRTCSSPQHQHDQCGSDDSGELRLGAGLFGDRRPRPARADRESLEEPGGDVRRADPDHLAVTVDLLAGASGE
jgi:hypothetical protein